MNKTTTVSISLAFGLLLGCSSMKTTSERDSAYAFSSARTYQWIPAPAEILAEDDTVVDTAFQRVLNNELAARGMRQVLENDTPDLRVAYYIKLTEVEEHIAAASPDESVVSSGVVLNRNGKNWHYKQASEDRTVYTSEVGTLTLLVHDARTGKRVWRGTLQTELDRSIPLEQQNDLLRRIAHKLMRPFPRELE